MFLIYLLFLPLDVFSSEVEVVKSHHSVPLKGSWYQDTGPNDPSLLYTVFIPNINVFKSCIWWDPVLFSGGTTTEQQIVSPSNTPLRWQNLHLHPRSLKVRQQNPLVHLRLLKLSVTQIWQQNSHLHPRLFRVASLQVVSHLHPRW